jgi:hypothetical protein
MTTSSEITFERSVATGGEEIVKTLSPGGEGL